MLIAEVKPGPQKGWVVVIDERERESFHRVRGALNSARRTVQEKGGGEVIVHGRNGSIVERQTVPAQRRLILS